MMWAGVAALLGIGVVLLAYWLLVLTEGTYLGAKVVALLYDWTASRYDRLKGLQYIHELRFLGLPLVEALGHIPSPRVLDVATGTGRLPLALLSQEEFGGLIIGVDRSLGMMAQAKVALERYQGRVALLQQDARALGFKDAVFDCVTCLEALEFMPKPTRALEEMIRVLRPGGVLLLSNRVGRDTWFFPARICGRGKLESHLRRMGLKRILTQRWQTHYDLVWASKASNEEEASGREPAAEPKALASQEGKGKR